MGITAIAVPLPCELPPHETEYHLQDAPVPKLPPVETSVDVDPLQADDGEAETETGIVDKVLIITETLIHPVKLQLPSALK